MRGWIKKLRGLDLKIGKVEGKKVGGLRLGGLTWLYLKVGGLGVTMTPPPWPREKWKVFQKKMFCFQDTLKLKAE